MWQNARLFDRKGQRPILSSNKIYEIQTLYMPKPIYILGIMIKNNHYKGENIDLNSIISIKNKIQEK